MSGLRAFQEDARVPGPARGPPPGRERVLCRAVFGLCERRIDVQQCEDPDPVYHEVLRDERRCTDQVCASDRARDVTRRARRVEMHRSRG